jgi:hypothetical protein
MKAALALGALLLSQIAMDAPAKVKQHVAYVAEPQTVAAGKHATLELKFHIDDGYHVNSHAPKSEEQIATSLKLAATPAVKLAVAEYPAGKPYSLSIDPSEKLDVYSDDFIVKVPVVAAAGEHELKGELTYQACDHAACYPPRTLPVDVIFTSK